MNSLHNIIEILKTNISEFSFFEHVYLFGSILKPENQPNDIDILVIYKDYSSQLSKEIKLFSDKIARKCGLIVDLTALSFEEEKEVCFVNKIKDICIKLK